MHLLLIIGIEIVTLILNKTRRCRVHLDQIYLHIFIISDRGKLPGARLGYFHVAG